MSKLAVHFGAGNIGRGFIAPVLEENKYNIIFVDVDNELVSKLNLIDSYIVSNFSKQTSDHISVSNFSAIELDNRDELKSALEKADLITTSVGPDHLVNVLEKISSAKLEKKVDFIAFENKYRASSSSYKEAKIEIDNLNVIDAVVDKIVPPQLHDSIDVTVEEYGSIILEDKGKSPLEPSEVVSYGDYEKEFIKKLWILNGLHLQLAYFGLSKDKEFIHQLFEDEKSIEFSKNAIDSLGNAYLSFSKETKNIDTYKEKILERFSMVEIKDSLIRVARNPILKFSKSERFHGPLYFLLKENLNFGTFQEVFHLLQNFNYENVDGFREFKKLFENGLEEFLLTYWQVDSDLEFYTSKLK